MMMTWAGVLFDGLNKRLRDTLITTFDAAVVTVAAEAELHVATGLLNRHQLIIQ